MNKHDCVDRDCWRWKIGRACIKENARTHNKKLHGHNNSRRTQKRINERLRRNFLHPQQVPPTSKFRHSLLTPILTRKKRINRRRMERKKTSLQTHRQRRENNRNHTKRKRQNQKLHNRSPKSPIHPLKLF